MAIVKSFKADVSSVSPSSERMKELWLLCVFLCRKGSNAFGGNMVTRIDKLNEKCSLITWGLRLLIWKVTFFVRGFCGIQVSPSIHNISNTVFCISRRMITVFLLSSQQDQKLNKHRMIAFYTDSKSTKHFCKLLTKSRDFLYFNFDRLTDQCETKILWYVHAFLRRGWVNLNMTFKYRIGLIDLTIRHYWAVVLNSMNINRNQ